MQDVTQTNEKVYCAAHTGLRAVRRREVAHRRKTQTFFEALHLSLNLRAVF